jgi:hypothetical protein
MRILFLVFVSFNEYSSIRLASYLPTFTLKSLLIIVLIHPEAGEEVAERNV